MNLKVTIIQEPGSADKSHEEMLAADWWDWQVMVGRLRQEGQAGMFSLETTVVITFYSSSELLTRCIHSGPGVGDGVIKDEQWTHNPVSSCGVQKEAPHLGEIFLHF